MEPFCGDFLEYWTVVPRVPRVPGVPGVFRVYFYGLCELLFIEFEPGVPGVLRVKESTLRTL
jgi:hypothetical protein